MFGVSVPSVLADGLERYFSPESLAALGGAHVGIAGAGGLGSNVAMLLVRSGIRRLTVADFDRVDASNLNRQFYFPEDLGLPKVVALERNLRRIRPDLELRMLYEELEAHSCAGAFAGCDILVEALDKPEYKAAFCNAVLPGAKLLVGASGLGGAGGPPMQLRRMGRNFLCVGDFITTADERNPPLAPRVMQAAAMQADAVLAHILGSNSEKA